MSTFLPNGEISGVDLYFLETTPALKDLAAVRTLVRRGARFAVWHFDRMHQRADGRYIAPATAYVLDLGNGSRTPLHHRVGSALIRSGVPHTVRGYPYTPPAPKPLTSGARFEALLRVSDGTGYPPVFGGTLHSGAADLVLGEEGISTGPHSIALRIVASERLEVTVQLDRCRLREILDLADRYDDPNPRAGDVWEEQDPGLSHKERRTVEVLDFDGENVEGRLEDKRTWDERRADPDDEDDEGAEDDPRTHVHFPVELFVRRFALATRR
jgi:hypothetical protein